MTSRPRQNLPEKAKKSVRFNQVVHVAPFERASLEEAGDIWYSSNEVADMKASGREMAVSYRKFGPNTIDAEYYRGFEGYTLLRQRQRLLSNRCAVYPGISRLSRSQAYAKRALFKKQKAVAPAKAAPAPVEKTVQMKGGKNGKSRVVATTKAPKYYPADDIAQPKQTRKTVAKTTLRASITPGTVLILLAGRFRGKRVVFLKQLASGLLLVSGPHKINGVPLRRVNQAYVIATSTSVDISKVKIDAKYDDSYFKVAKDQKVKPTAEALFGEGREKAVVSAERVKDQKEVDAQILAAVKKVPTLKAYLNASFALSKGQYPHNLKF